MTGTAPGLLDPDRVVLRALLERRAREAPDRTLVVFEDGTSWSRRDALRQACAAAHELRRAGVGQGDVVAVALQNGPGQLRAWWGTAMLGAAILPLNPALRGAPLARVLQRGAPSAVVTDGEFAARLAPLDDVPAVLRPGDLAGGCHEAPVLARPIGPWDVAAVATTSGTTGRSKLVRVAHPQCFHGGTGPLGTWSADERDTYLADIPMVHVSGLYLVHAILACGGRVAMRSRPALDAYWETLRDTGATISQLYGTMPGYLSARPRRAAERAHRCRVLIAVPLPPDPETFRTRFGIRHLSTGYGSTEVGCVLQVVPGEPLTASSLGRALPGFEVRLVDENDVEVPRGAAGRLIVRSATPWTLSTEYLGDPAATVAAWRNGWFHTGDLLREGDDGAYHFVDRLTDSLRRRGENVSSVEVEGVVAAFPGVAAAAVVPERSAVEVEDEIKVWVLEQRPGAVDFAALLHHCARGLPHYMVPRYFEAAVEFPRTPAGKIRKRELRERGSGGATWDRLAHGLDVTRRGVVAVPPGR